MKFADRLKISPKDGKWYVFGTKHLLEKYTGKLNQHGIVSAISWDELKNDWQFMHLDANTKAPKSWGRIGALTI